MNSNLPAAKETRWPLTPEETQRVEALWSAQPELVPPYEGLSEEDAVLVHRYMTGMEPFNALVSVNRSRSKIAA